MRAPHQNPPCSAAALVDSLCSSVELSACTKPGVVGKGCAGIEFGRLARGWLAAALLRTRTAHGLRAGLRDHRTGERRRCSSRPAPRAPGLAPLPRVTSPRLYVIDCGTLVYNRPEDYNLTREE